MQFASNFLILLDNAMDLPPPLHATNVCLLHLYYELG